MNEIKIFSTRVAVLVNHLNYGNHLGYDSVLSILQESRLRWLKTINQDCSEINIENNVGWLIREVRLSYETEAHHGDELNIDLFISNCKKTSFVFEYVVANLSNEKTVCRAATTQICFNFEKLKISRIPETIASFFKKAGYPN